MIDLIGKKTQIACGLLCCCSMAYAQSNDNSEIVVLNAGWEFSQAGTELWRPAQVPGTVHQDLIYHKQIPDPFYGINEQKIQWVENEMCIRDRYIRILLYLKNTSMQKSICIITT